MTRRPFGWDLPPGVTSNMIPGNRPQDIEAEQAWETVCDKIPTEFADFVTKAKRVQEAVDKGESIEKIQDACIDLVNFCSDHEFEHMLAEIEEAGTYSPPGPGDAADYHYDRAKDEGLI